MKPAYRVDQCGALAWLAEWPDHSVDLVITDPAYESLNRHRKRGKTTRLTGGKGAAKAGAASWFKTIPNSAYKPLAREWARVLKPSGCLVLFGDDETQSFTAIPALVEAGWAPIGPGSTTYYREVIWDKVRIGMGYGTRRQHERVIVWRRPHAWAWQENPDYDGGFASIQSCPPVRGGYPTEKPMELLARLVRQFSRPGDLVIDPFCGSGSSGQAALATGRSWAGADISTNAVALTRERLALEGEPTLQIPARADDQEQLTLWAK